jgi:CheY-like chemotaxis protein
MIRPALLPLSPPRFAGGGGRGVGDSSNRFSPNALAGPGLLLAAAGGRVRVVRKRRGRRAVTAAESKATILVVDDNTDNVEILRAFLESRGFTIAEARDGRTALARMEEVKPDLVLLDVMMPGMDGWEVCRVIKQHPQLGDTRVVMVTAKGGFEDKFEGLRSGADDYVVKPVDFKDLMGKVERNLAARGGQA